MCFAIIEGVGTRNRSSEKGQRRALRKTMPKAEVILWSRLKGKNIGHLKFRRQYGVGRYIVDFFCAELNLAIEIDGDSHYVKDACTKDAERQLFIEEQGIAFLRFTNKDIFENLDGVIMTIEAFAKSRKVE